MVRCIGTLTMDDYKQTDLFTGGNKKGSQFAVTAPSKGSANLAQQDVKPVSKD